jgi:hypothetical protein
MHAEKESHNGQKQAKKKKISVRKHTVSRKDSTRIAQIRSVQKSPVANFLNYSRDNTSAGGGNGFLKDEQ